MGMIQYYHITCKPVNQAICIFYHCANCIFCNLVWIKCISIIVLLYYTPWIGHVLRFWDCWLHIPVSQLLNQSFVAFLEHFLTKNTSAFVQNIYIYLLLLKKVGRARLGESDIHPISPKTPALQYPTYRQKQEKGKESRRL